MNRKIDPDSRRITEYRNGERIIIVLPPENNGDFWVGSAPKERKQLR